MIVIITAPSSSGKTLMARKLMMKYNIPYYMMDNIKMGFFRSNPDCGFHPEDEDQVITDAIWPFMREMIKTSIENEQDLILEGCYMHPKHLEDLEAEYKEQILPIFFGFSDEYIREGFQDKIIQYRNVVEKRQEAEERSLNTFISAHRALKNICKQSGYKYFEIQKDYKEIDQIYGYIDERLAGE